MAESLLWYQYAIHIETPKELWARGGQSLYPSGFSYVAVSQNWLAQVSGLYNLAGLVDWSRRVKIIDRGGIRKYREAWIASKEYTQNRAFGAWMIFIKVIE